MDIFLGVGFGDEDPEGEIVVVVVVVVTEGVTGGVTGTTGTTESTFAPSLFTLGVDAVDDGGIETFNESVMKNLTLFLCLTVGELLL